MCSNSQGFYQSNETSEDAIATLVDRIKNAEASLPFAERNYRSEQQEITQMRQELSALKLSLNTKYGK